MFSHKVRDLSQFYLTCRTNPLLHCTPSHSGGLTAMGPCRAQVLIRSAMKAIPLQKDAGQVSPRL